MRKLLNILLLVTAVCRLLMCNFKGNQGHIDVSLTSYDKRIFFAPVALMSFLKNHKIYVNKVFLAIDDVEKLSIWKVLFLKILRMKGLYIIRGPRVGPHAKYYHYIVNQNIERPLIIIDDDCIYKGNELQLLAAELRKGVEIACMRALEVKFDGEEVASYASYELASTNTEAANLLPTNVGGTLLSVDFLKQIRQHFNQGYELYPTADDVFFYALAKKLNYRISLCCEHSQTPWAIPFLHKSGLSVTINVAGNDQQLSKVDQL